MTGKKLVQQIKQMEKDEEEIKVDAVEECEKLLYYKESWNIKTKYYNKIVEFWVKTL